MEIKKIDNKSLIIYTSMIFAAAILMIVISFFAQKHLDDLAVNEANRTNMSLTNKTVSLSEENSQLVELNKGYKEEIAKLEEKAEAFSNENMLLLKENSSYAALIKVYNELIDGDKKGAQKLLAEIFTEDLSSEQKDLYDFLVKESQ